MPVRIQSVHVPLTAAMRSHVERALSLLDAREDSSTDVRVRLRDLNGPKGGRDQEVLVVHRARGRTLTARAVDADAYVALSTAIERVARRERARARRAGGGR
jgi:ribosome-associated translation inhibitor RaiA